MLYMEQIRGYPYMSKKQLMGEFQKSRSYVNTRVKDIEREIQLGRYNRYTILDSLINVYAFMDCIKYGKDLADKNARKYVPEFNPVELMELCGYNQRVVRLDEENA